MCVIHSPHMAALCHGTCKPLKARGPGGEDVMVPKPELPSTLAGSDPVVNHGPSGPCARSLCISVLSATQCAWELCIVVI